MTPKWTKNFGNYSKDIFGNHLTANGCQNAKFCDIVEIWKKLKMILFLFLTLLSKVILQFDQRKYQK